MTNYASWLQRTKSEELIIDLKRSFSLARSSAIKHGGRIRLCASNDAATCSGTLNQGWIIFLDLDGSKQVNDTESIIQTFEYNTSVFVVSMLNTVDSSSIDGISFNYKGYSEYPIEATVSGGTETLKLDVSRSGYVE